MDFIIDTAGDQDLQTKSQLLGDNENPHFVDKEKKTKSVLDLFEKKKEELDTQATAFEEQQKKLKTSKDDGLFEKFFEEMNWNVHLLMKTKNKGRLFNFKQLDMGTGKLKSKLGTVDVEKEMKKSVIQPGFEKQHTLPSYYVSARKLKAQKKKEREKTKGPEWFNLPAPEVTKEMRNDLQVLKMRSALDPKHFYKKNDMEVTPKYFQVGRIEDSPLDHVNQRITRQQRKRTMVDELLADAQFQKYNKKKYKEIIDDKRKSEYRTHMRDKRQKNKQEQKKNKTKGKKDNKK